MLVETSIQKITRESSVPTGLQTDVEGAGSNINVTSTSLGISSSSTLISFLTSQNSHVQTYKNIYMLFFLNKSLNILGNGNSKKDRRNMSLVICELLIKTVEVLTSTLARGMLFNIILLHILVMELRVQTP